jgi:uncharacterized membrane protein YjjB (DUF3815 family)
VKSLIISALPGIAISTVLAPGSPVFNAVLGLVSAAVVRGVEKLTQVLMNRRTRRKAARAQAALSHA